jgi:tetratricopeptide (TPR) repeat protein
VISRAVAAALVLTAAAPAWAAKPKAEDPRARAAREAAALSQVAASKNDAGEFKLCADLYLQAFRTDPGFLAYLFGAARCEQKAGDLEAAERDYRVFLQRVPSDDPYAPKAQGFLQEVQTLRKQAAEPKSEPKVEPKPGPATPPTVVAAEPTSPPAGPPPRLGAWSTVALGAVAAGVGVFGVATGLAARAELERDLEHGSGLITAMTPGEARERDDAARLRMSWGGALLGVGAVAAGAGLYFALRPAAEVQVTWNGSGIALAGRF